MTLIEWLPDTMTVTDRQTDGQTYIKTDKRKKKLINQLACLYQINIPFHSYFIITCCKLTYLTLPLRASQIKR